MASSKNDRGNKDKMPLDPNGDFRIFDHLLEGCQVISPDWKYLYLNDAVLVHAHRAKNELLGKTMMEAYPGIEETELFSKLKDTLENRKAHHFENKFVYPDGEEGWFRLSIEPVPQGILVLSFELTQQKKITDQLIQQRDRLYTLRQIDLAINSSTDIDVVVGFILDQISRKFKMDAAQVLLYDEDTLMLQSLLRHGFSIAQDSKQKTRIGEGIAGRTALERKTRVINILKDDVVLSKQETILSDEDFVCCISSPLISNGQLLGILEVYNRSEKEPDDEWMVFFETVAGQTATAIDNLKRVNQLEKQTLEYGLAYDQVIESWAETSVFRDIDPLGHNHRVMIDCIELAIMLDYKENNLVHIRHGALLHDIGMVTTPRSILQKSGKLDNMEWALVKKHPATAVEMLSKNHMLIRALDIPRYHHEWWDGSGYPHGLAEDLIPEPARIFALVDVWDILRRDRPYRKKLSDPQALEVIISETGTHFDPHVVEVFLKYRQNSL